MQIKNQEHMTKNDVIKKRDSVEDIVVGNQNNDDAKLKCHRSNICSN